MQSTEYPSRNAVSAYVASRSISMTISEINSQHLASFGVLTSKPSESNFLHMHTNNVLTGMIPPRVNVHRIFNRLRKLIISLSRITNRILRIQFRTNLEPNTVLSLF